MPALDRLMKKLGYVKLSAFGLVLTPEGRVLSMRPAVLDDGLGGKIVGWQDGDLAAAELERWGSVAPPQPARPAAKAAVATRVAPPIPQAIPMVVRETVVPASVAPIPTLIRPSAAPKPVAPPAAPVVNVAPQPPAEEDDWEWTIAIARARAAAEDAEAAAVSAAAASKKAIAAVPASPKVAPKVVPAATVMKTLPIAKVAADPAPTTTGMDADNWPKTEPLHTLDPDDFQQEIATEVVRVVKAVHTPRVVLPAKPTPPQPMPVVAAPKVAPAARTVVTPPASAQRAFERGKSPATVIPVPKLPSVAKTPTSQIAPVTPVVRAPSTPVTPLRPRLAKGTGPYLPKTGEVPTIVEAEPPPLQPGGEDTVPHMVLPPVARASRA